MKPKWRIILISISVLLTVCLLLLVCHGLLLDRYARVRIHASANTQMQEEYVRISYYAFPLPNTNWLSFDRIKGDYYRIKGLDEDYLYYHQVLPDDISALGIKIHRFSDHSNIDFGLVMRKGAQTPIQRYGIKKIVLARSYFDRGTEKELFSSTDAGMIRSLQAIFDDAECWEDTDFYSSLHLYCELNTNEDVVFYPSIAYDSLHKRFHLAVCVSELATEKPKDELGYYYRLITKSTDITDLMNTPAFAPLKDAIEQVAAS